MSCCLDDCVAFSILVHQSKDYCVLEGSCTLTALNDPQTIYAEHCESASNTSCCTFHLFCIRKNCFLIYFPSLLKDSFSPSSLHFALFKNGYFGVCLYEMLFSIFKIQVGPKLRTSSVSGSTFVNPIRSQVFSNKVSLIRL